MPRTAVFFLLLFAAVPFSSPAPAIERTAAPAAAEVYIVRPTDGERVRNPVTVVFGLHGMGVAPAGVKRKGTGHHHLIIDANPPSFEESIQTDEGHLHFGGGQTETAIRLSPGKHTLRLLFADYNHVPHQPPLMSDPVTIFVKDNDE